VDFVVVTAVAAIVVLPSVVVVALNAIIKIHSAVIARLTELVARWLSEVVKEPVALIRAPSVFGFVLELTIKCCYRSM